MVCRRGYGILMFVLITGHVECSTYSIALLGVEIQTDKSSGISYEFLMINEENEELQVDIVNIESTIESTSIPANGHKSIFLDEQYGMNGTEYANKSLVVKSSGNFTLQVFSASPSITEGFLAIPMEDLNGPNLEKVVYEYVISTFCGTSGFCQIGVTALEEAEVRITFPAHVDEISFCKGSLVTEIFRSHLDNVLLIKKYHAVQIETTRDLTGTHVYSFNPIVVFVGSRNVSMANGLVHMVEQLTPSSQWGTKYAISTLGNKEYGDVLRISASWPNTVVNMTGYQKFVISKKEDVVTRRLEKDSTTFITASAPIQVVQITGVDYATNDNSARVAMVTVPAKEHFTDKAKISCGTIQQSGQFFVASEKTEFPIIMGVQMSDVTGIPFTPYKITKKHMTVAIVNELYGSQMGGVVKCDNGAVVPIKVTHSDRKPQNNTEDVLPASETTCLDGISGWILYEQNGYQEISTSISQSFDGFSILKLRLIKCGEVHVTINTDNGFVDYRLSMTHVFATDCVGQGCQEADTFADSFNTYRECSTDMAWYWLRISHIGQETQLCFGFGPIVNKDDGCPMNAYAYSYAFELKVTDFVITPIFTPVYFNYGDPFNLYFRQTTWSEAFLTLRKYRAPDLYYNLETDEDCRSRISSWRCEDKIQNCSTYGNDFCDDPTHDLLATKICPKFCKKCFPDSYGRKFVFPFTHQFSLTIYITMKESLSRVGVTCTDNIVPLHSTKGKTLQYRTDDKCNVIWIVSDRDVAVSVMFDTLMFRGFNVFPVDSFSTEYFLLPECTTENCMCNVVTEGTAVVTAFTNRPDYFSETDGKKFTVIYKEPYKIEETRSGGISEGIKLIADQPIGVFCGGKVTAENYAQVVPSAIYGTFYRLPPLSFNQIALTNVQLVTKAVHPNTEINITGSADNFLILETIGKVIKLNLNTAVSYTIESNEPIVVGLQFMTNKLSRYIPVPPTSCYMSNIPLFYTSEGQIQMAYVSETGVTDFKDDEPEGTVNWAVESTFGILMRSFGNIAMFLPSYFALVPFVSQKLLCSTTTSALHDGKDNDCDGRTDEDICSALYGVYGIDGDLDGDFDGDCGDTVTEPVIVPELPPLVCQEIEQKFNHCWIAWKCPCSWVQNLQSSSQLTDLEFKEIQHIKIKELEEKLAIATENLTAVKSQKITAEDDRVSAANVGYVGITLFVLVFGLIFVLDLTSLYRDLRIFGANLRVGLSRLNKWRNARKAKDKTNVSEAIEMDENMVS